MTRLRHPLLAWAFGLCLVAPAAWAARRDAVLGGEGELYLVRSGAYGELFPGGKAADAGNPVLALDVVRPNAPLQRVLVPGTSGPEAENSASLLYEQASSTVFLVWESAFNVVHPSLKLTSFDGASWSPLIDVTGKLFSPKNSPLLAVTRDQHEEAGEDGAPVVRHRTVLHLLWVEDDTAGQQEALYTPIVLEDGVYTGNTGFYRLAAFDPSELATGGVDISADLERSPALQGGSDGRTVVAGFVAAASHRLVTLEIDVLPAELTSLADGARAHIIDIGARFSGPGGLSHLAEAARAHIVDIGRQFHPEVARSLGDEVRDYILAHGTGGLTATADGARAHIIDIGAKLSGRGLRQRSSVADPTEDATVAQIVEVRAEGGDNEPPLALLQVRLASSRPVPQVGTGSTRLYVSENGQDVLIAWAATDRVLYRDSAGAGWSDTRELRLSPGLTLDRALEILEQRVRNR